ncbi:MAG TPA: TadE family protein [Acidimicrobiales bacterium]|nr:TadE family protein [Acidimicrobiales bacterium]
MSRNERGSLTAFVAVLGAALFVLVGLVVDGGRAIDAHRQAMDAAREAARVGADQLSVDGLRSGEVTVDPAAAVAAVTGYLTAAGEQGSVQVDGDTIVVHVDASVPTAILGMIGIDHLSVSASASATNLHGVTRQDP